MEFSQNKPIYLQIADSFYEKILSGELKGGDRIASVRETGAALGVNPNTVMRSYEKMTADGVIFNRRGIGFFISPEAGEKVLAEERRSFIEEQWPEIRRKMELLGLDLCSGNPCCKEDGGGKG